MADDRKKGGPLPAGDPRRMTDARCAWRKMTPEQREKFLRWVMPFGLQDIVGVIVERATRQFS